MRVPLLLLSVLSLIASMTPALPQDRDENIPSYDEQKVFIAATKEAIDVILNASTSICNNIDFSGSAESRKLGAGANATLNNLFTYIANLGLSATADSTTTDWINLLQEQLAEIIITHPSIVDKSACRLEVFRELRMDMLPPKARLYKVRGFYNYTKEEKVFYLNPKEQHFFSFGSIVGNYGIDRAGCRLDADGGLEAINDDSAIADPVVSGPVTTQCTTAAYKTWFVRCCFE